jgi:bifunctional DNase/RNase
VDGFVAVEVVGVRVEMPSNSPMVLVRGPGELLMPIWIGPNEAAAIAMALQGVTAPRPLTHDLFVATLSELRVPLQHVRITHLSDGVFYGQLVLGVGPSETVVDARPSDAIALALRAGVSVLVAQDVLAEAGVRWESEEEPADEVEEVQRFREFLDSITPQDFQ